MIVLLVDDDEGITRLFERILADHIVHSYNDPQRALEFGQNNPFDLLVTDQRMPRMTGIELIHELGKWKLPESFLSLVVSAYTDSEDLIDAVNSRTIYRYLVKPVQPNDLLQAVYQAYDLLLTKKERERLQRELYRRNEELELQNEVLQNTSTFMDRFIGFHPETIRLKEKIKMFAISDSPVLISGETGTGKELIARALHEISPQREGPFVALNCSAFSPQLLDSELFGHAKGAYTGAGSSKKGLVETAEGGTLFLDEIAEFPFEFQAKVLRFIQFGTFIPVGGIHEKQAQVRIISATNKDLSDVVNKGAFRQDLYYRLNTLMLTIPPLRRRVVDIIPIMEEIAGRKGFHLPALGKAAKELIQRHPFHGNVRELEAFVEKLHMQHRQHPIEEISPALVQDLLIDDAYSYEESKESSPENATGKKKPLNGTLQTMVEELERRAIIDSLENTNYNISHTAEALGISRQGLKNKMKRYEIYAYFNLA